MYPRSANKHAPLLAVGMLRAGSDLHEELLRAGLLPLPLRRAGFSVDGAAALSPLSV